MSEAESKDTGRIAELNDLLQLDRDAVQAYTIAIENLDDEPARETLRQFRGDHERHITELTHLIHANGGDPAESAHLTTGLFKLAVQQVGRAGGDRGILLAFEVNERQVRDKYRRCAEQPHPPQVQAVLRRNAADEEHHYTWVLETLQRMGVNPDGMLQQATDLLAQVQARAADLMEGAERTVGASIEEARESARKPDR